MDLTEQQAAMLALERVRWRYAGAKDAAILERTGLSPTRYYAALNRLIDTPEALAAEPVLVRRLVRLRAVRRSARR